MTPPRSASEIISDPEYQRKRREYDEEGRRFRDAQDKDAQPLLDELKKFGLHYEELWHLISEPKNTFVLAIPRMVEYLGIFKIAANIETLANALARPEAKGIAAKPLIEIFRAARENGLNYATDNTYFQIAKAIQATAQVDDVPTLIELFYDDQTDDIKKCVFLKTISKLSGSKANPILVKSLDMGDEIILTALGILKKRKIEVDSDKIAELADHNSPKIRRMAQSFSSLPS